MSRPLIGITASAGDWPGLANPRRLYANQQYADALVNAGAAVVLIPFVTDPADLVDVLDGWLIPGGDDIDASNYGEANHPKADLENPGRFPFEKSLFELAHPRMPILGICYGCQMINVVRGGSLHQHLPDVLGHDNNSGGTMQECQLDSASRTAALIGAHSVTGKSYHHQAINRLGAGLVIAGYDPDGIIEAVEDASDRWLFAVQWHPERTPDSPESKRLFQRFVEAAAEYQKGKKQ